MVDMALVTAGFLFSAHLLSLALSWRKCSSSRPSDPAQGRVSLVRPICGLESHIAETLASSFTQAHPDYEVIFCAAHEDDPAAALVRSLIRSNPDVDAHLLFGEAMISQNPKLNNMAKGWAQATGDLVIFADSNLLLPADYCSKVAAAFEDGKISVVSSPPVGDYAENFWGEVECAMLNTHAARWQFAAAALGMNFAQGKTLAFRRSAFGPELMRALASEPAEDAATTKLVKDCGQTMMVLAPAFVHPVGERSLRAFWNRHVRWARLRRATFPVVFAAEAACGLFPAFVAVSLSSAVSQFTLPFLALALATLWYGAEYLVARSLGWRTNGWFVPACIVRDVMLPLFYIAAWTSGRFEWRGRPMNSSAKLPA